MTEKPKVSFEIHHRERIVSIARSWIGTPYHHQESIKGIGCDCLGLLRGVWKEFYGTENPEQIPNYSPSWGDHRVDDPLLSVAEKYFIPVTTMNEGDVLLFRMRKGAAVKHCSIFSGNKRMIHAYSNDKVREDEVTEWWDKKLIGIFKFGGMD